MTTDLSLCTGICHLVPDGWHGAADRQMPTTNIVMEPQIDAVDKLMVFGVMSQQQRDGGSSSFPSRQIHHAVFPPRSPCIANTEKRQTRVPVLQNPCTYNV